MRVRRVEFWPNLASFERLAITTPRRSRAKSLYFDSLGARGLMIMSGMYDCQFLIPSAIVASARLHVCNEHRLRIIGKLRRLDGACRNDPIITNLVGN